MDHYVTLGVAKSATADEIKSAYRKLAMQFHPDRNPGDESAAIKFKQVKEAYEVIGDPLKRSHYDVSGPKFTTKHSTRPQPTPQPSPPKPKTKDDFEREKRQEKARKAAESNPTESQLASIQCSFFNSSGTGRNVQVQMKLTPSEMQRGGSKTVIIKKRDLCGRCVGDGKLMLACSICGGSRMDVGHCRKCNGYGAEEKLCPSCNGEGVRGWTIREVGVRFSPNIQIGHVINVLGEGESAPNKPPGNLRVVVV